MSYVAPLTEQRFALEISGDLPGLAGLPAFAHATPDLVDAILDESARLAEQVFAPLNRLGDTEGARWNDYAVSLPDGFREAYQRYAEGGWMGLVAAEAFGGQGLPFVLSSVVQEQVTSANMAFSLCMLLSHGAIEALSAHASPAQQATYLTRMVSGEWTGTMNLTEPQAGSDVGALRTRATPHADGTWRIKGQKIFITFGEHDCASNIVHLVLARLPEAPAGTRGISLFIVPKFLVNADGSLGARNDVRCVSIEHKLGLHASPTCTMSFGDHDACVGYLVGAENAGMRAMFTMMNQARIDVGLQGVAIAERAYQGALAFARERVQSVPFGSPTRTPARIIEHMDVRRTLMTMRAMTEASRALTYCTAGAVDRAHAETDAEARAIAQGRADLLTPVTKAFASDVGVEVGSLGIQVFGGMGYVEETGAAQHLRDARIAPIYEGTNGIQALDLVGRKLTQNGGRDWRLLLDEMRAFSTSLAGGALAPLRANLDAALDALAETSQLLSDGQSLQPADIAAGATPYLRLFGLTAGACLLARQADVALERLAAGTGDTDYLTAKVETARFFVSQILPQGPALVGAITAGAASLDLFGRA